MVKPTQTSSMGNYGGVSKPFHLFIEQLEPRQLLTVANFAHPGILNTQADFTRMATQVAAGAQPWLSDWNALTAAGYAKLGASPRPLATVSRGGTGSNFAQMYIDIERSYDTVLEWKVTGNTAYADQTVKFLNAWSSTMTTLTGDSDRFLASGLYGFQWANIAEIMRGYSGWAAADQTKFATYLTSIYLPMNQDFLTNHNTAYITNYWANWDLCNLASEMAIGIFTNNHTLYQQALTYIYSGGGNGAFDKAVYYIHAGNLGQGQEEGRDQGHSNLDIALMGQICQMAWNQGDDLFSYNNNELLAASEYLAKYNLGNNVPYENYYWGNGQSGAASSQVGGASSASRGQLRPIFELIYNHYVNIKGLAAPYTTQALAHTRPEGDNGNGDEYSWGTLTFALNPLTTIDAPQSLVAYEKGAGNIELDWWGGANDVSYNVYRATNSGGTYTLIASGLTIATTYTDTNLPAGTYYYRVTGVSGTTETVASNIAEATGGTQWVGQLQFNDGTGAVATDSIPGGPAGMLNGGATWTTGKSGKAVSLNGRNGYVSLPSNVLANVSDFTISAWVYLNSNKAWSRVFDFGNGAGNWMYLTTQNSSGKVEFATSTTYGYNKQSVDGTAPLPTGKWTHVAVTFSDRLATIYVNGVAVGSNANMDFPPYEIQQMTNDWIGRSQFSADPYLNGKIDDFRIYRGAMTAGEINTLATQTAPAAPASLIAAPGDGHVALNWAVSTNAATYTVKRATVSGGPYVTVASGLSATQFTDTSVTDGITYYYVVSATNVVDQGANSAEVPAQPNVAPAVSAFVVNDGSAQRSMVDSLALTFSQAVTLDSGAFTLDQNGVAAIGVTVTTAAVSSTQYVLTFSGPSITGGSLKDGRYTLVVSGSAVSNASGVKMASDASYGFLRLFGDIDGNGAVNGLDYAAFQSAYGSTATNSAYLSAFDYDGNGAISGIDYGQFRTRYGTILS